MNVGILSSGVQIVTSGLCMWLDAGQKRSYSGTGTTWTDLTTNGNNGTLNNTTFDQVAGGSFIFDGSTSYVSFASLTNMNNQYATHELWALFSNPTAAVNEQVFARTNTSTGTFNILKGSTLKDVAGFFRNSTNVQTQIATGTATSTSWQHIAITYDGTTFILYINTTNTTSATISSNTINTGGTLSINLGRNTNGVAYFTGQIAIARAYDRALSATEISQNFYSDNLRFGIVP